jgi:hypothetical protein
MNAISTKSSMGVSGAVIGGIVAIILVIGAFGYMYFIMAPFNGTAVSSVNVKTYDTSFIDKDMKDPAGVFNQVSRLTSPINVTPVVNYQQTDLGKNDVFNYE